MAKLAASQRRFLGLVLCGLVTVGASAAPGNSSSTGGGNELIKNKEDAKPSKFLPPTKEESEAMMKIAKDKMEEVSDKMHIKFRTLETPHFLVFSDWDPREDQFLKTNVEAAYSAVSKQFDIPVKDNVFVGKLPVFMFKEHEDFMKFARDFDNFDAITSTIAGYYQGNSLGHGHMAMWKPDIKKAGGNVHEAEKEWAYVLTHEFTHAFIARYRTNAFIPRWLNEGLAEVIASGQFPRNYVYGYVKGRKDINVPKLLAQTELLKGEDYPVVRTLVETLVAGDRKGFINFFNDIKDGMPFEEALKKEYKTDKDGFEKAWRKYLQTTKG